MATVPLGLADLQAVCPTHAASAEDAVAGVSPVWVAEPESIEQASALLRLAHDACAAVAPRGGGTKLLLGNPPARLDGVLSTRRLNHVLEHASGDLVARVEAGTRLRALQETVRRAGQWLAIDPPEADATIGGIIAANSSGSHRLRYGTMRDLLIGITYLLPDGTVAHAGGKVVKNVAGYDLCKLFTGSLGTLGIVVEAIVRLHPLPSARRAVILEGVPTFAAMGGAVQDVLHSALVPSALDFSWSDGAAAGQDSRHTRDIRRGDLRSPAASPVSESSLPGNGGRAQVAPTTNPSHVNDDSPRRCPGGTLGVLFEGIEVGVEAQTETAAELWSQYGTVWIASEEESREMWRPMPLPTVRLKLAVPVASLPAVLVAAETILGGIPSGHLHGHAGSGIALIDLPSVPDELPAVIVSLRRVAERGGGSLVVQRAPAEALPSLDVWGESAAFPLMRRVKAAFDGTGTLNPGRFVGGL